MRSELATALLLLCVCACDSAPAIDAGTDTGIASMDAGPRCAPAELPTPLTCNGHAELCDRRYSDVAFAMTHNAMNSDDAGWLAPNQGPTMWQQLSDGVRGMMLDTYEQGGEDVLCHGPCALGSRPLSEALSELREFMDCHPAEVLTLILEAHIDEARTAAAFEDAGLMPYLHTQALAEPWPTMRSMIESGRRMVVFTESSEVALPWHHYAYAYTWDNDFSNQTPSDLDCEPNRGTGSEPIFVLNHFLTSPIALPSLAEMINHQPFFGERVEACRTERDQMPNFIAVDFYEIGDVFEVVDALNGQ